MKKIYLILAAVAMILVAGCQKPAATTTEKDGYDPSLDPNKPTGVDDLSVTPEQHIEQTAKDLMTALDVNNWRNEAEFVHKVAKALQNKDWDSETVELWAQGLAQSWTQDPRQEGDYTIYETIVHLSDAKGHFEEQTDGSIKYTQANDLQFTVLVDGEKVTATFTCVDSTVPIIVSSKPNSGYDEKHNVLVYAPASAVLRILRGSSEFASLVLNMSASVQDPSNPNPYTDSASIEAVAKVGVYTIGINRVAYSPNGANVNIRIMNGNASLIFIKADAAYTLDAASQSNVPVKNGSINSEIDIMGEIQLKGQIPDFATFMEKGQSLNDNNKDAQRYPVLVTELENTFSASMYFNGAATPRATLGLEAVKSEGSDYWYCNPVIRFSDGSSYGVENYFSEERFGGLVQYGQNWFGNIQQYLSNLFSDL